MRNSNSRVVGTVLAAALATIGILASTALGAPIEWLVNGEPVTTASAVNFEGELELSDTSTTVGLASVLCSLVLVAKVEPEGAGTVTEVLTTAGEKIGEKLAGTGLLCKGTHGCETGATDTEVWIDNLPWATQAESILGYDYWFKNGSGIGWEVKCLVVGLVMEDSCEGITRSSAVNTTEGVSMEFNPGAPVESPSLACTQGGSGAGQLQDVVLGKPVPILQILTNKGPIAWAGGDSEYGNNQVKVNSTSLVEEFSSNTEPMKYESSALKGLYFTLEAGGTCTGNVKFLVKTNCKEKVTFAPEVVGWWSAIMALKYEAETAKQKFEDTAIFFGHGTP